MGYWGMTGPENRMLELPAASPVALPVGAYGALAAPPGRAWIRFNEDAGQLEASISGGAFAVIGASTSPGGADHDVQFNDAGSFGGNGDFSYDGVNVRAANELHADGGVGRSVAGTLSLGADAESTTVAIGHAAGKVDIEVAAGDAAAFDLSAGAATYLAVDTAAQNIAFGDDVADLDVLVVDENQEALTVRAGGNDYLSIDSRAAGPRSLHIGPQGTAASAIRCRINMVDSTTGAFRIYEAFNTYIACNTNPGGEQIFMGNDQIQIEMRCRSADARGFELTSAGEDYIVLDTDTRQLNFGDATGNPDYQFFGTGEALFDGAALSLLEQAADPGAVAGRGKLYFKDVAGVSQLFVQRDDGSVSQIS